MSRRTVRAMWESYRAGVMPSNAPPVQVIECRRAYYAGAQGLMAQILNGIGAGPESTEPDEDFLLGIEEELTRFAVDVSQGRA
jgi:hypothetical protein